MRAILEVIQGVPLPGQYDGLKGIDLYGDGEVYNRKEKKDKKKAYTDNLSQKVAAKTATFKAMESPIFVDNGSVMSYDSFVDRYGSIVTEEVYDIITETYIDANPVLDESRYLYQLTESTNEANVFSKTWYPVILTQMKKTSVKSSLHKFVTNFINNYAEPLSVRYPTTNIIFNTGDIELLTNLSGVGKENTSSAVKELIVNLNTKTDFKSISKSPQQIVFTGMLMAASELKDEQLVNDMITVVAFSMYPLIFRKYFPRTDPNKLAMEEAVMTASMKFYIAKTKNILEWVRILTEVPYKFYKEKFEAGNKSDLLYVQFLNRLRNTMNQQFKSLYKIYKAAYDRRGLSKLSSEDYVTLSSNSDKVEIYTQTITTSITGSGYKANVAKSAAQFTNTDLESLESYIKEIYKDPKNMGIENIIRNMLTIYFNLGNGEEFLAVAIKQYQKIMSSKQKIYADSKAQYDKLEEHFKEMDPKYIHKSLYGVYIYFAIIINISTNNISNKLTNDNVANDTDKSAENQQ